MNNIKVIYEDSYILVLDKPSGLTVNRSETALEETVQDFVEKNTDFLVKNEQFKDTDFYKRSGMVHRIDKETSGILVFAKTKEVMENLQTQFKERKVDKVYVALAHGKLIGEGEINVPIGRLPWNRKRFGVMVGGRDAVTKYKVLSNMYYGKNKEHLTLLELYPKTGRTHQIRVHLKHMGHPIFGDEFYAGRKTSRNDRKILSRFFLHASKISFYHPQTGELVSFESELPEELQLVLRG